MESSSTTIDNTPNGVWRYGYETTLGGSLTLYTDTAVDYSVFDNWLDNIASGAPAVYKNMSSSSVFAAGSEFLPYQLAFHPGPQDQYSIIRFTAPITGTYSVSTTFSGTNTSGTTTDVHVLDNSVGIYSGEVTGYGAASAVSYSATLSLKAGDKIDFAVGYGTDGNFSSDSTGIDATLSTTAPVPSGLILASTGGATLAGYCMRRRKTRGRRSHRETADPIARLYKGLSRSC